MRRVTSPASSWRRHPGAPNRKASPFIHCKPTRHCSTEYWWNLRLFLGRLSPRWHWSLYTWVGKSMTTIPLLCVSIFFNRCDQRHGRRSQRHGGEQPGRWDLLAWRHLNPSAACKHMKILGQLRRAITSRVKIRKEISNNGLPFLHR